MFCGHSFKLENSHSHCPPLRTNTQGTWFLFDVVFYGNALFEPFVLEAAFGPHSSYSDGYELLQTAVRDSLVISLLSLPGYFITVFVIGRRTCLCVCRAIRSSLSTTRFGLAPCDQSPGEMILDSFSLPVPVSHCYITSWTASNIVGKSLHSNAGIHSNDHIV